MRLIDEEYTRHPFYGSRRLTAWLNREGYSAGRKRIQRLMRHMGIETLYQKPNLSRSSSEHRKYPYLLKGLTISRPDQVWSADITYIRMNKGFVYLMAVIDLYSRYVLTHEVSVSLDAEFCVSALKKAMDITCPEIFNTDQGVQFTASAFTDVLKQKNVAISMDGRGRAFDNIFVERLWRSVKYEEVYIHDYETVGEAVKGIGKYFRFYNTERPHQSLDYKTPHEMYFKEHLFTNKKKPD
jgi:putative transposase